MGNSNVFFNESFKDFFRTAMRIVAKNPSQIAFMAKTARCQLAAVKLREKYEEENLHVPPVIISSITSKCNLKCKGCYSNAKNLSSDSEMSVEQYERFFGEAKELGVSVMLLAGGEPFMRREILETAAKFPEIVFPVFNNGTLIGDDYISFLKDNRNIIPILSIEGNEEATDTRRGPGSYKKVMEVMKKLDDRGLFFGTSITATSENYMKVTADDFIKGIINHGVRLFFFEEFVPLEEGTLKLVLKPEQKDYLMDKVGELRKKAGALYVVLPGRSAQHGGCPAAGGGFIHISPEGFVEPCPFAPFSVHNLKESSLKEALESGYLKYLRDNHTNWQSSEGGCGLWSNKEWVLKVRDKHTEALKI